MEWTKLKFGRHKGKKLPKILFSDPSWFFDAYKNKIFQQLQPDLMPEVKDIYQKARHILPKRSNCRIECFVKNNTFVAFQAVHKESPLREIEDFDSFHHPVVDMNFPMEIAGMTDPEGNKELLLGIKMYIFNNSNIRFTNAICEDFFNDNNNFDMESSD